MNKDQAAFPGKLFREIGTKDVKVTRIFESVDLAFKDHIGN